MRTAADFSCREVSKPPFLITPPRKRPANQPIQPFRLDEGSHARSRLPPRGSFGPAELFLRRTVGRQELSLEIGQPIPRAFHQYRLRNRSGISSGGRERSDRLASFDLEIEVWQRRRLDPLEIDGQRLSQSRSFAMFTAKRSMSTP